MSKITILFLCTGNSCRSQMAEGWAKHLKTSKIEVYSAGIEKHGLNPLAVKVMAEKGIDIAGHSSKTIAELDNKEFDYVITVCGHANEHCPIFQARTKIIHHGFVDPPLLAKQATSDEEVLVHYRRVRDEIQNFVEDLLSNIIK